MFGLPLSVVAGPLLVAVVVVVLDLVNLVVPPPDLYTALGEVALDVASVTRLLSASSPHRWGPADLLASAVNGDLRIALGIASMSQPSTW